MYMHTHAYTYMCCICVGAALGDRDDAGSDVINGQWGFYGISACSTDMGGHTGGCNLTKRKMNAQPWELVDVVSLPTLLSKYPIIDFVDMDVQGAEWVLFNATATLSASRARDALDAKVLRIHIGTHDTPPNHAWGGVHGHASTHQPHFTDKERTMISIFRDRGWVPSWTLGITGDAGCVNDPDKKRMAHTPWGPICMADGAFGFVNTPLMQRLGML